MKSTDQTAVSIRAIVEEFIDERRNDKLEKDGKTDAKRAEINEQFKRERWLEDLAKRLEASQSGRNPIKLATHTTKPGHPDSTGANWLQFETVRAAAHCVVPNFDNAVEQPIDVTGNAAYKLNEYKFLNLKANGKRLFELAVEQDGHLLEALCEERETALRWAKAFATLVQPRLQSDYRVKQVYWLTGEQPAKNADFDLLAPLYATSLAHRVFRTINDDRFSDTAKAARKARYDGKPSETSYCDYPGLAVQKFGGSKPQNISQLNSERGGTNYLLSSQPPTWRTQNIRPPLRMRSAFRLFGFRNEVRRILRDLRRLLGADPKPVMDVRDRRDELTEALIDELLVFSIEIQNLAPGWSAEPECRLDAEEQYWLDPGRAITDADFRATRANTDWPATVRRDFAAWLNRRLSRPLMMSDAEHRAWAERARRDMDLQRFIQIDRAWMDKLSVELDQLQTDLPYEGDFV